jgi:OOP family OmpA-OmpF porin
MVLYAPSSFLPGNNFADQYWIVDPREEYELPPFATHYELGVRFMINESFGLKLDGAYNTMEDGDGSRQFESNMFRIGLQGVVNFRSILNFDSWTQRFGLLAHAGVHQSWRNADTRDGLDISGGEADHDGGLMIGFTPQFRLSNTFTIYGDYTALSNFRTQSTIDGGNRVNEGLEGLSTSTGSLSIGLQIYLGGNEMHADYYMEPVIDYSDEIAALQNELDQIDERVAVLEARPYVDNNNDGINDLAQDWVTNNFMNKGYTVSTNDVYNALLTGESVNIFFGFGEKTPEVASVADMNTLINFMKDDANSDQSIILTGYTDNIGDDETNKKLANDRARFVYDILLSAGVDPERIEYEGIGVNPDFNTGDIDYNRTLARRVSVRLRE